jgi:protein NrfC
MQNSDNPNGSNSKIITSIDQKDLSRRKFLQIVGVFAVSVSGTGLLSCEQGRQDGAGAGCGVVIPDPEGTQPDAAAGECMGYILVDRAKCQSCYTCMAACSLVNEGASGFSYSRIQVAVDAFAKYPYDVQISQCRQCQDPQCVAACPTGAMHIDKEHGNIRLIDVEKCIGCGMCVKACPFEAERSMLRRHDQYDGALKSRKCDLCLNAPYHFAPEGGGIEGVRTCEAVCPMKAIKFFPLMPAQEGDAGYIVNLRNQKWKQLGFDVTLV